MMHLSHLGTSLFHHSINVVLKFVTIYQQPFPLPYYYGIGDLPIVDSAAETYHLS
jgi:hypothetical protein